MALRVEGATRAAQVAAHVNNLFIVAHPHAGVVAARAAADDGEVSGAATFTPRRAGGLARWRRACLVAAPRGNGASRREAARSRPPDTKVTHMSSASTCSIAAALVIGVAQLAAAQQPLTLDAA